VSKNLTIIINTFKSEDKIFSCLDSIDSIFKVLVIENSNNDELKKKIESLYSNVQCILTGKNLGYAKGNNLGLSKVNTKYALILNPDTTLEKNTIKNFFDTAEKIKDFAIIGPAKQNEFNDSDLKREPKDLFEVKDLKGFAMFLNLDQFKDIGYFDQNFFIYLEEIDLCKRLRKKNRKIFLDKKIIINHLGGKSHNKEIDFEMELSRNWHWMWSSFYFNRKHFGYLNSFAKIFLKLISSLLKTIFYTFIFNNRKKKIYFHRLSGLLNSIIGKKSWYRPKI
tara:strand:+ start:325 stop:1164 length:840 start_codon:yes stop_codon:yes gene_type:complete